MASDKPAVRVEIAHVGRSEVYLSTVNIMPGTNVREAIEQSNILNKYPEINLDGNRVGIFGRLCGLDHIPIDGDRIEIYRPLSTDPREARRRRQAM